MYYYIKFFILTYILCSFTEWFLHSQIMHGNMQSLSKVPIIGNALAETSRAHMEHHKEVNMDMTLNHDKLEKNLFFSFPCLSHGRSLLPTLR